MGEKRGLGVGGFSEEFASAGYAHAVVEGFDVVVDGVAADPELGGHGVETGHAHLVHDLGVDGVDRRGGGVDAAVGGAQLDGQQFRMGR